MARPKKRTVDYFPHDADASDGRTISILENNFGADGYMVWFKLLSQLCRTDNQVIYLNTVEDTEFLASKMRLSPERMQLILQKMADLEAIDKELYGKNIIWCQKLVDRLKPIYDSRKEPLPVRPGVSLANNPVSLPDNPINLPDNTQTKLKETKVNIPPVVPLNEFKPDTSKGEVATEEPATLPAADLESIPEEQREALKALKEYFKNWKIEPKEDIAWLSKFKREEYPELELSHIRDCADYHSGRAPPRDKGDWKNRLRNWMRIERERIKRKGGHRATNQFSNPGNGEKGRHITTDEERRRGLA